MTTSTDFGSGERSGSARSNDTALQPASSTFSLWSGFDQRASANTSLFFASSIATGRATGPLAAGTRMRLPESPDIKLSPFFRSAYLTPRPLQRDGFV